MDTQDALFEDIQAISDDAEALGLKDVALVLEFAMDVFLRDTRTRDAANVSAVDSLESPGEQVRSGVVQDLEDGPRLGWSMSMFPLMRA